MRANAFVSMMIAAALIAASSIATAQNATATAPARETPRPQDIDPAVNTSATPPASETSPEAAPGGTSSTATNAAAPATTSPSRPTTASGARPSSASGASSASSVTRAPGAATASPNATGQGAAANAGNAANVANTSAPGAAAAAKPGAKGKALDRLELDTTQITGNRELPKVLYIVPWKRSDLGDLVGKPVNSLLDEVLTPVDRDVFQRENRYYRALTPGAAENDALSAPDGRPPAPVRDPVRTNSAPAAGSQGSATHPSNASAGGVSTGSGSAASPPRDEK